MKIKKPKFGFNKRGVMLEFLVGVILAILIFTPTCMFTAKIFRLSQQGTDSFDSFVGELNDLSKITAGKEGDTQRISVLTLDEETAMVYFSGGQEGTLLEIQEWQEDDYWDKIILGEEIGPILAEVFFQKPSSCKGNCICLFTKPIFEVRNVDRENAEAGLFGKVPQAVVSSAESNCRTLDYPLQFSDCDFGPYEHADSESEAPRYACKQGFVIERLFVKKINENGGLKLKNYHVLSRRIPLNALKTSDGIITLLPEVPKTTIKN